MILTSICFTRTISPTRRAGTLPSASTMKSTGFFPRRTAAMVVMSYRRELISYSLSSIVYLPDSTFEKSRMSLIISRRPWPDFRMVCTDTLCVSVRSDRSSSSLIPRITFMGVLISWLILARNTLFISAACRSFREIPHSAPIPVNSIRKMITTAMLIPTISRIRRSVLDITTSLGTIFTTVQEFSPRGQ